MTFRKTGETVMEEADACSFACATATATLSNTVLIAQLAGFYLGTSFLGEDVK